MIGYQPRAPRDIGIRRSYHAAFAGHDILRLLEAEHARIADRASFCPVKISADRLASVFNHLEPMSTRDRHDPVHVRDVAGEVYHQNRFRMGRNRSLDCGRIDAEGFQIHIHENWY